MCVMTNKHECQKGVSSRLTEGEVMLKPREAKVVLTLLSDMCWIAQPK